MKDYPHISGRANFSKKSNFIYDVFRDFCVNNCDCLQVYLDAILDDHVLGNSMFVKKFLDPENYRVNLQGTCIQLYYIFLFTVTVVLVTMCHFVIVLFQRKRYSTFQCSSDPSLSGRSLNPLQI